MTEWLLLPLAIIVLYKFLRPAFNLQSDYEGIARSYAVRVVSWKRDDEPSPMHYLAGMQWGARHFGMRASRLAAALAEREIPVEREVHRLGEHLGELFDPSIFSSIDAWESSPYMQRVRVTASHLMDLSDNPKARELRTPLHELSVEMDLWRLTMIKLAPGWQQALKYQLRA